jgi:integrase
MVRLYNGERVSVSASGATKREADDNLRKAIDRRLGRRIDPRAISKRQGGRAPRGDVVALLDVILGTGLRIGEVLALRWCDVVQDGEPWLVDVNATMVELIGRGQVRQSVPKTDASDRLVPLPAFSVEVIYLMRSLTGEQAKPEDYVSAARWETACGWHGTGGRHGVTGMTGSGKSKSAAPSGCDALHNPARRRGILRKTLPWQV